MQDLVLFTSNEVGVNCISSLIVSEMFDIRHGNLCRTLESLAEEDGGKLNFEFTSYKTEQNVTQPMCLMSELGFFSLMVSLNLKTEEHKAKRKEILSKFSEYQSNLLKELKQLRAERKPKMLGAMETAEYGTKYKPKVPNEDKKILVLPSVLHEISVEEPGYYNVNDFTAEEILICMIALDGSRQEGITNATKKKQQFLEDIIEWRIAGREEIAPDVKEYIKKSEYNDVIAFKLS